MNIKTLNVLIIDQNTAFHRICSELLQSELDVCVVGYQETAVLEALQESPDVVVMGINIDEQHRWQLLKLMQLRWPMCSILALGNNQSEADAIKLFETRTVGFLASEDLELFLAKAVKKISEGEAWVPRKFVPSLVERFKALV